MNREDIVAVINYWNDQELLAWERVEECQNRMAERLGELVLIEMSLAMDEKPEDLT